MVVLDQNPMARNRSRERAPVAPYPDTQFSLHDALEQARATAERLDKELFYPQAQMPLPRNETEASIATSNKIFDIRDDRFYQAQAFGQRDDS
jgi:hypothetical protein